MSTARDSTVQSTSSQRANGEPGPSRSTDHMARLCHSGVGTAMWLGTTSQTMPIPRSRAAAARARRPSRPPSSSLTWEWSTTS